MQIGELARQTGVDVQTIRYYEREGLMVEPSRSDGGYRQYRLEHQETLNFIRHCRSLDMTLAEIRTLLDFRAHPERACEEINQLLAKHLEQVQQRITQMQQLELQLKHLQLGCGELRTAAECGILQTLNAAAEGEACVCHQELSKHQ